LALAVDRFTGLGVSAGRVDSFGAVPEGSEFAARIYAAINTRDRGAIKALSAPDIVVGTTVEAYRGAEALLEWLDEGDDAFDDFTVELLAVEELAGRRGCDRGHPRPLDEQLRGALGCQLPLSQSKEPGSMAGLFAVSWLPQWRLTP
jgi:hypothetical protein